MEFSNYRVAWDEREASPVRTTFQSITSTPFTPTYRALQDDPQPAFFEMEEPKALFAEKSVSTLNAGDDTGSPTSTGSSPNRRRPSYQEFEQEVSQSYHNPSGDQHMDLGNYRVGWNMQELGKRARLLETPGAGIGAVTFDASKAYANPSETVAAEEDDEEEDDRVWNEEEDQEAFVARLKSGRPRTASAGSGKSFSADQGKLVSVTTTTTVKKIITTTTTGPDGKPQVVTQEVIETKEPVTTAPGALGRFCSIGYMCKVGLLSTLLMHALLL